MESLWNSLNKVDLVRLISQWIAGVSAIIALIFSMRYSTLKSQIDLKKDKEQEQNKTELKDTRSVLENTNSELDRTKHELEKIKPRPLPVRLRNILQSIDPKISPALTAGHTGFNGGITSSQFNDLQKIAKEPGASKYITISPDVNMGLGMGPEGVTYGVTFTLNPQLLKD